MSGTVSTVLKYVFLAMLVLYMFFFTYVFPVLAVRQYHKEHDAQRDPDVYLASALHHPDDSGEFRTAYHSDPDSRGICLVYAFRAAGRPVCSCTDQFLYA